MNMPVLDSAPQTSSTTSEDSTANTVSTIEKKGLDGYISPFKVELEEVRAANTPPHSNTYQPVPHGDLYDRVRIELEWAGIKITEEMHSLYRGGDRYIGLAITDLKSLQNDAEVVVGWFNSHDHSHAATLLLGERVMVCFNLCLHAEIKVCRRHTKHIRRDLPGLVAQAVDRVRGRVIDHGQRMDRYRAVPLPEMGAHHLVVQLVEDGALPAGQLRSTLREWRTPSHAEFDGEWNVNRLYQAVTGQGAPLSQMARRHRSLHRVMDAWCDEREGRSRRPA